MQAETTITVVENEGMTTLKRIKKAENSSDLTEFKNLTKNGVYTTEEISTKNIYTPLKDITENEESGWFSWLWNEEKVHGPNAESTKSTETRSSATNSGSTLRPPDEDGWGNENWWLADDPGNGVGNPPGTSPDAGAGNGNFQLSAPVISLPGRGITKLNVLKNTKQVLTGSQEILARIQILTRNILIRGNGQIGLINSIIGRAERGVALAR